MKMTKPAANFDWQERSPGIWVCHYDGFVITKIKGEELPNTRRWCDGKVVSDYRYNFIAIKPGTAEADPVRFVSTDIEKLKIKIYNSQVKMLF